MGSTGIGFAAITGLLAVYFFIGQSQKTNDSIDESKAELRCEKANFDLDFSERSRDAQEKIDKLKVRVDNECSQFAKTRAVNQVSAASKTVGDKEIQDSIKAMMK